MKESHLKIKDCVDRVVLSDVEVRNLIALLSEVEIGGNIVVGQFGCAIGSGAVVEVKGKVYDITDYESW